MTSDYRSTHLALALSRTAPAFTWFAVDSLGRGERLENVVLDSPTAFSGLTLKRVDAQHYRYVRADAAGRELTLWSIELSPDKIVFRSRHFAGMETPAFSLLIDQKKNHATLLGLPAPEWGKLRVPAVLHLPDRGTFRITASASDAALESDARRRQPEFFVRVGFPAATAAQREIAYTLETTLIHPDLPGLAGHPRYDGYRRNFLNLIQFHPRLGTLANNSSSDVCGFCLWQYAELAVKAPPLAPGLTVLDLLRVSLDRVFNGGKTYGQAGWGPTPQHPEAAAWSPTFDSLDTLPSFIIAGSRYILGSGDRAWADARIAHLVKLGREMLAQDRDGNGLIEYRLSGNSGTWDGKIRPANWWDTIGFGHEDAFSNALAYRACLLLSEAATATARAGEAEEFAAAAAKLRAAYYKTYYNPATGVLAGWKSADGRLHDYGFTFISGMAIAFGLVDDEAAHALMDRLLGKMDEVGFTRFDLGLPGNLVPIRKEDYSDPRRRYGGSEREDGSDGFQIYENGAATHCHAYWLVKALYRLGRVEDARRIYHPMLKTFAEGGFQGFGENGLSKDWRSWTGECSGYEGYLSDGYLALLAVEDDLRAGR